MNLLILSELKKEYLQNLQDILSPLLFQRFLNFYKQSNNKNHTAVIKLFQIKLKTK